MSTRAFAVLCLATSIAAAPATARAGILRDVRLKLFSAKKEGGHTIGSFRGKRYLLDPNGKRLTKGFTNVTVLTGGHVVGTRPRQTPSRHDGDVEKVFLDPTTGQSVSEAFSTLDALADGTLIGGTREGLAFMTTKHIIDPITKKALGEPFHWVHPMAGELWIEHHGGYAPIDAKTGKQGRTWKNAYALRKNGPIIGRINGQAFVLDGKTGEPLGRGYANIFDIDGQVVATDRQDVVTVLKSQKPGAAGNAAVLDEQGRPIGRVTLRRMGSVFSTKHERQVALVNELELVLKEEGFSIGDMNALHKSVRVLQDPSRPGRGRVLFQLGDKRGVAAFTADKKYVDFYDVDLEHTDGTLHGWDPEENY